MDSSSETDSIMIISDSAKTPSFTNISKPFILDRIEFLRSYISRQNWSLPDSIICYILMNPNSAKFYQKLVQSCKYFFIKNSILVISRANFKYENEWKIEIEEKWINLNNFLSKIWITEKMFIDNRDSGKSEVISTLIPKIYNNETKRFEIWHQNLSINNFIFLASKCENIILHDVTILNENGSIVTLDEIIETLLNAKKFEYHFSTISSNAIVTSTIIQKLVETPQFQNLFYFRLANSPETFNHEILYDYKKKNKKPDINLEIDDFISVIF
uniref:Uncharacterized protein n=1 Tax=Panagrolaimus sp. PS1159 TaxID=55785 RepID=A0AC35GTR1_9BILA